jgi:AraC-like DNA-binding protein
LAVETLVLNLEQKRSISRHRADRQPGTLLLRLANTTHAVRASSRIATNVIGAWISQEATERLKEAGLAFTSWRMVASKRARHLGFRLAVLLADVDPASGLSCEGLLLELLGELFQKQGLRESKRPPLKRALALLHDRFQESIGLGWVAQEVGLHPVQLAQEFRRQHRVTVGEYLRKLRVEHARVKLISSSVSISKIAHELGFADHSHFCHVFKRYVGTTPRQFRDDSRR